MRDTRKNVCWDEKGITKINMFSVWNGNTCTNVPTCTNVDPRDDDETYFCSKMCQIQTHGQKALTSNYDSTYPSDIKK